MRTRTTTRTRQVPHTIDGRTVLVEEAYTVDTPVPPTDWDARVRTGMIALDAVLGAAAITWSTAAIGSLLHTDVPAGIAYAAAATFDLVWIGCMGLEWLARYDPERAAAPRRFGWAALAISMAAIIVHGKHTGSITIGVIGAAVSLGAKVVWNLTLRTFTPRLDRRTQQWVNIQRAESEGQLALVPILRELATARSTIHTEHVIRPRPEKSPEPTPETPEENEDPPEETPELPPNGPMTMTDAIRTALSCGITDPDSVTRYVRKVADANAKEESIRRTLRELRRKTG